MHPEDFLTALPWFIIATLKKALWLAKENPGLERKILSDLKRAYRKIKIEFNTDDYALLVGQYEQLHKMGSYKALGEIKQVQSLKKQLIARMPRA